MQLAPLLIEVRRLFQSSLKTDDEFQFINGLLHTYPNMNQNHFEYLNCQRTWLFKDQLAIVKISWRGEINCQYDPNCVIPAVDWVIIFKNLNDSFHISERDMHAIINHDSQSEIAKFATLREKLAQFFV